jgi:4-hydroxybenzoate polyprenyltransferase
LNPYPKAMRLERWPRSTAILVGSTALFVLDPAVLSRLGPAAIALRVAGAFFLTWAISTANYIINEIADAPFDVHHPTKKTRPLASGAVRKGPLLFWAAILAGASLAPARLLYSRTFFLMLLALLLAGFAYNLKPVRTKDIPFLDSISESVNNPIRFLIGWYALAAPAFPPWSLLVGWWAFGNFLMVAKRLSEFRFLGERAGDYRASLRRYSRGTLLLGMGASAAVLFAGYFAFAAAYRLSGFYALSPFLAFYLFLFFRKTLAEKEVMEEPEKLLARPKYAAYTAALILLFAAAFLLGRHGH